MNELSPSTRVVLIATRFSSRTNHRIDGTYTPLAALREPLRTEHQIKVYEQRREAACIDPDEIARRHALGEEIKRLVAQRPTRFHDRVPNHKALVPVGRVRRRKVSR